MYKIVSLSKCSPLKQTCSWYDKLIVLWILNRQAKICLCILNKIQGQGLKEESDDDNEAKAFDFAIESQKSEVKVEKNGCKKGEESDKSVREGKEKWGKETGGFMRAEEENLTQISEENRNISWSSNTEKIKEASSLDNMGVTGRTEPIVNYQEGQNLTKKYHKINNVTPQTDNTIMIYN